MSKQDMKLIAHSKMEIHHHHKHQGLDPLISFVSKVTTVFANVSLVFQMVIFHKSWATPSDATSVSSSSKSDFLRPSLVIPGQYSFSYSREERMKASSRRLKTKTFG